MFRTIISVAVALISISAFGQEPAPKISREDVISIQIGLDDAGFSPGQIDGKWGGMTRQALAAWQQANELKPTGEFDAVTAANFPAGEANYTNYVVTAADLAKLTRIPEDWKERSQLTNMWFETVVEMVAEKCHASEGLIRTLNPGITNWGAIGANQSVTMLNLSPAKRVAAAKVRVSLSAKTITAYDDGGKMMAMFPCSIAADKEKRTPGQLTVQTVAMNPNYTFDPVNFPELDDTQKGYGKLMVPPGPKNPVGTAWIGLSRSDTGSTARRIPTRLARRFLTDVFGWRIGTPTVSRRWW